MRWMRLGEGGKGRVASELRVELLIWRWYNTKRGGGGWGVGSVDGDINGDINADINADVTQRPYLGVICPFRNLTERRDVILHFERGSTLV